MDIQQVDRRLDSGKDRTESCESHGSHVTQAESKSEIGNVTDSLSAEIPCSNGMAHSGSDESLTDVVITSEDALLLPDHVPVISHKIEKESPSPPSGATSTDTVTHGSPPICTPPTASAGQRPSDPTQAARGDPPGKPRKKCLPSTSKSQQSLKTNASQIEEVAGDDCCAHCILDCLFCEVLSLCSALTQCLACGQLCEALCCCGEACVGGACCSEATCSALLDCAILEDCCQSGDCLEICLECCSICFPT